MRLFMFALIVLFSVSVLYAQSADSLKAELEKMKLKQEISQEIDKQIELKSEKIENTIANYKNYGVAIVFIISFLGISGFVALYKFLMRNAKKMLLNGLEKIDPKYMPLWLPANNFENEKKRLLWLDFKNINTYEYLDSHCLNGCVVFKVDDNNPAENLVRFLEQEKPDEIKVGYILYTRKQINPELFQNYSNVTFSNNPLTLSQAIFIVARGIMR